MRAPVDVTDAEDELFDMANLSSALTGLPMVVWISERGRSRHDVRIKVSLVHGRPAHPDQTAAVSLRPTVEVVAGPPLDPHDLTLIQRWVELNRDALLSYWDGSLLTDEVIGRLVKV